MLNIGFSRPGVVLNVLHLLTCLILILRMETLRSEGKEVAHITQPAGDRAGVSVLQSSYT